MIKLKVHKILLYDISHLLHLSNKKYKIILNRTFVKRVLKHQTS